MRVVGATVGVNDWKNHYQSMVKGTTKPKLSSKKRAKSNIYQVPVQTGNGPTIKVISPTEANVKQARKLVQVRRKSQKSPTGKAKKKPRKKVNKKPNKKSVKRKRNTKKVKKNTKKKRLAVDIFTE